jgi:hypothetical protein
MKSDSTTFPYTGGFAVHAGTKRWWRIGTRAPFVRHPSVEQPQGEGTVVALSIPSPVKRQQGPQLFVFIVPDGTDECLCLQWQCVGPTRDTLIEQKEYAAAKAIYDRRPPRIGEYTMGVKVAPSLSHP